MREVIPEGFMLCDEVRSENTGKLLAIGIYNDSIGVISLPVQMRLLTFVFKLRVDEPGNYRFTLAVGHEQNRALLRAEGNMDFRGIGKRSVLWAPVVFSPVTLAFEGRYSVHFSIGDAPEVEHSFEVLRLPAINPEGLRPGLPTN